VRIHLALREVVRVVSLHLEVMGAGFSRNGELLFVRFSGSVIAVDNVHMSMPILLKDALPDLWL
jgi:hypothetical protein